MNKQHTSAQFSEPISQAQGIAKVPKGFHEKMIFRFEG
jgi:hypothetical protein